jgi:hypothetical protein
MMHTHLSILGLVAGADDACRRGDLPALSLMVRSMVSRLPHALQFDAVAVAELAALREVLACDRWRELAAAIGGAHGLLDDRAAA